MITKPISRDEVDSRLLAYVIEAVVGIVLTAVTLIHLMWPA